MAINKTINKSTKSHGAMRNCIEYVLRGDKTESGLVYITGPFLPHQITFDTVYNSFLDEKKLWGKDSGRMYAHNVISWHKDEQITLQEALDFGKVFAEKWFYGFQTLVGVHIDRDHIHLHLVTNTVSYEDGHKLHNSKMDLARMKEFTNQMCEERGLTVAVKGKDFHGNDLEEGHVRAWSKDKYHLMLNDKKKSHVAECALAVMDARKGCTSREEFIQRMGKCGWNVTWTHNRKNITFENEDGKKVRDSNLSKTFNMKISKEELLSEFERQKTECTAGIGQYEDAESGTIAEIDYPDRSITDRESAETSFAGAEPEFRELANGEADELELYYAEIEAAIAGTTDAETVGDDSYTNTKKQGIIGAARDRSGDDTAEFIGNIRAKVGTAESGRQEREAEQSRRDFERKRQAEEAERRSEQERQARKERSRRNSHSR